MNKDLYTICLSLTMAATVNLNAQFKQATSKYMDGATSAQFADFDKDGFNDLVVGTRGGVVLMKNHYSDIFAEEPFRLNWNDEVVHVLDIDGDGFLDILSASSVRAGVRWMHNQTNGSFSAEKELFSSGLVKHFVSGDIDGDGDHDLIVNTNDRGILLYRNNSNGEFGTARVLSKNTASVAPSLADMDGDLDLDIFWQENQTAYWAENIDGRGIMASVKQLFSNGNTILADIDGDGLNDLVSLDLSAHNLVWQKCLGSANTFAEKHQITAGIKENGTLFAVDMDVDGDLDLVFSSDVYDEILWVENRDGKAHFNEPQRIVGDVINPSFMAFGDIDNDGDLDLVSGSDEARSFLLVESDLQFEDMIMGRVYNDADKNGVFNAGDHGLAAQTVGLSDGRTTYTDNNGLYMFPTSAGSYTISIQEQDNWDLTTGGLSKSVAITAPRSSSLGNDFGLNSSGGRGAVKATLANAATRCGLVSPYWITVTNTGSASGEVTAHLKLDEKNMFVSAELEPSVKTELELTWEMGPMHPFETRSFKVYLAPSGEALPGDKLSEVLTASLRDMSGETTMVTDSLVRTIDCDMASNTLQASPEGYGVEKAISWSQELTYTASFQNTTGDMVQHVFVEDTLDEWLDVSTFEVLSASHDYRVYVNPTGVIQFYFENIDLLDASKDGLQSKAYVSYRVKPLSWVPNGTEISNQAHFFFGPEHKESSNIVSKVVGESISLGAQKWAALTETNIVYPNPTNGPTTFDLSNYDYDRVEIHLIDAAGRVIFKREMRGGQTHFFQLGALGKGNYLVRALPLETGIAELLTKLVIQ